MLYIILLLVTLKIFIKKYSYNDLRSYSFFLNYIKNMYNYLVL